MGVFTWYKPFVIEILVNCRKLHQQENVHIIQLCTKYFEDAYKIASIVIKLMPAAVLCIALAVSAFGAATTYFLEPNAPYPMPFLTYIPFLPPHSLTNYLVNLVQVECAVLTITTMTIMPFCTALVTYVYTWASFDAIAKIIREMIYVKEKASLTEWVQTVSDFLIVNKK